MILSQLLNLFHRNVDVLPIDMLLYDIIMQIVVHKNLYEN